jgi:hypothetical protein
VTRSTTIRLYFIIGGLQAAETRRYINMFNLISYVIGVIPMSPSSLGAVFHIKYGILGPKPTHTRTLLHGGASDRVKRPGQATGVSDRGEWPGQAVGDNQVGSIRWGGIFQASDTGEEAVDEKTTTTSTIK